MKLGRWSQNEALPPSHPHTPIHPFTPIYSPQPQSHELTPRASSTQPKPPAAAQPHVCNAAHSHPVHKCSLMLTEFKHRGYTQTCTRAVHRHMAHMWFMLRNVFESKKVIFLSSLLVLSWELPVSQCPQYRAIRYSDRITAPLGLTRLLSICSGSTVQSAGRACPCPFSWQKPNVPSHPGSPTGGTSSSQVCGSSHSTDGNLERAEQHTLMMPWVQYSKHLFPAKQ